MKRATAHEKYAAKVRAEGRTATPYRIGLAVAAAGDKLPSTYPPGSRGDHNYLDGLEYGRTERRIEAKARQLYAAATANDPSMHCNRFPAWSELSVNQRWPWHEKAIEALAGAQPKGGA